MIDLARMVLDLKRDEGVIPHAYQDHLGYWTIGVGRLIDKRKGGGLSPDEIEYLLANDITKRDMELRNRIAWYANLDEVRQRALLNMAFQLGVDGLLSFKTTLAHMQAGQYADAAKSALDSKWARQTPERAGRVAKMIETGVSA